jgi:hypothetical protein
MPIPMSDADKFIRVTKLEAARCQLKTAIELWVDDRDPVSTHTLAFAAYQVIHDLNRHAKGPTLLLDSEIVKPERKQDFINAVKEAAVFFKHADNRVKGKQKAKRTPPPTPDTAIKFDPKWVETFFAYSIVGVEYLKYERNDHELTFLLWYGVQHPEIIAKPVLQRRPDLFDETSLSEWRKLSKAAFFKYFLSLPTAVDA